MNIKDKLRQLRMRKNTIGYKVEAKKNDFAVQLEHLLDRNDVNKKELAARMETSPAYISKVLRGDANVTIETMVKLADAAGGEFHFRVADKLDKIRWFSVMQGGAPTASTTSVNKSKIEVNRHVACWDESHAAS